MNAPRACWTVLAQKAQDQVSVLQAELAQGRARLDALQASRARLQQLYADYQQAPAPGSTSCGMQETLNLRQFSAQLQTLLERVEADILQMMQALNQSRQRLAEAERERLKMQSLVDQDLLMFKAHVRRREQKQMDDMGVMQFNLASRA